MTGRTRYLPQAALIAGRRHTGIAMHAFIIEDDYLIAQSLRDMLERLGFTRFSFARSEDAAVQGSAEQQIDLITADVRLLPGDGVDAVEAICARRHIPVVFITGYADELSERAPNATVVQKPIDRAELEAAVAEVFSKIPKPNLSNPA
jgi:CheY-like chemotaxis protein